MSILDLNFARAEEMTQIKFIGIGNNHLGLQNSMKLNLQKQFTTMTKNESFNILLFFM